MGIDVESMQRKFKNGDWVFGVSKQKGCSQVFTGSYGDFQPFDYLNNNNPDDFRLATRKEIREAKRKNKGG